MRNKVKDYLIILAGAVIFALSVTVFTSPNQIAPGGVTGVATLLNFLFNVPIGAFILVVNVPLFIFGYKYIGNNFLVKSIVGTVLVSLLIDILDTFVNPYKGEVILAAIFGGALNGTGLALIFSRGGSSGGVDILATFVNRIKPHISVGNVILVVDVFIIFLSALVYQSIESGLYASISIFVSSKIIDTITYGTSRNNGKMMFIITTQYQRILQSLLNDLSRGVTVIDVIGGYSGQKKKMLVCALRPHQVFKANNIAKSVDSNAFIIVTTAGIINGTGFSNKS